MHDLIYHKNTLYLIKRRIATHQIDSGLTLLRAWKDYMGVDHILKKNNYFLLCNVVKDAEIISETIN